MARTCLSLFSHVTCRPGHMAFVSTVKTTMASFSLIKIPVFAEAKNDERDAFCDLRRILKTWNSLVQLKETFLKNWRLETWKPYAFEGWKPNNPRTASCRAIKKFKCSHFATYFKIVIVFGIKQNEPEQNQMFWLWKCNYCRDWTLLLLSICGFDSRLRFNNQFLYVVLRGFHQILDRNVFNVLCDNSKHF